MPTWGGPFGAALAGKQRKCTHYTLLTQSSSPRRGLEASGIDRLSTRYRHCIACYRMDLSISGRYSVDHSSMGLCPSPPGSGLPYMDIPSGPWGKAMDGGGQPYGLPDAPPTALPHLPTPASDNSPHHCLQTILYVCSPEPSIPPRPERARGFGMRLPGAGARSPGNAGVRR